ncbi:exodeoxyribonuclease VII large subunit [Candidatus Liberibacter sp.]|uniref:exodeoxyribonuclease VII large subunit n=1 Tax=Candidatus Liberibacter sp. TaxID=34022 RepID=UPI0015F6C684|nr:exodeoxyribonuclease VII large subunit [Candidatus Liberibacter sp.]MBA5724269.1 exodeoxyribonuclease VII large subunit [Candidatus Liberibacter sp.]
MIYPLKNNSLDPIECSISELSGRIKFTVESNFSYVRVRGEISGYRGPHSSGNAYFALKDARSKIDAVIWKGTLNKMEFTPEEGIEFLVSGRVTTFPGSSKYQIIVESLSPSGVGALMTILEERKGKLRKEGLFSDKYKNPIPFMPKIIAVITSPTGAVIRDILQRISCRFPLRVIVFPVKVQGEGASQEITNALRQLNSLGKKTYCPKPDTIILARGGGSLEDLWCFNDEIVVRAVAESSIPLISAIGHETDWTLVDYAADLRAPTPTGAAEIAVPLKSHLTSSLISLGSRLQEAILRVIGHKLNKVYSLIKSFPSSDQIISCPRYRLDKLSLELKHTFEIKIFRKYQVFKNIACRIKSDLPVNYIKHCHQNMIARKAYIDHHIEKYLRDIRSKIQQNSTKIHILHEKTSNRITHLHSCIQELINRSEFMLLCKVKDCRTLVSTKNRILLSLSHKNTLKRGYSIIRDGENNPIMKATKLHAGKNIILEFFDGRINATITNENNLDSSSPHKPSIRGNNRPRKSKGKPQDSQGSLF